MKRLIVLLMVVVFAVSASAALLPISNASFEDQVLGEFAILAGPPTGWGLVGGPHYIKNPGPGDGPGAVTDGDNALFTMGFAGQYFQIFQNIGNVIDESKDYTMSVDVYIDPAETATWFGMKMQILAPAYREVGVGGVGAGLTGFAGYSVGNWFTVDVPYTPIAGEGGAAMQLYIESSGLYLDNVRVSEVPEPATMALLGLGGLLLRRRKQA